MEDKKLGLLNQEIIYDIMTNQPIEIQIFLPFMVRIILGSLFVFQAYDKLYNIGLDSVKESMLENNNIAKLPSWFFRLSVTVSTYVEIVGGLLLILGLFKTCTLIGLGINLMLVTIGLSFTKGMWDLKHVFPRNILLVFLMFIPFNWDVISIHWMIDYFINIK